MNDFMVDMALNHFGFNDQQKARIIAAIPKVAYVVRLMKNNRTVANDLIDVFDMILTQVSKQGIT